MLSYQGLFLTIKKEDIIMAVEISIVKNLNCETEQKTTNALERNLIRDLYDIAILEPLTAFDIKTLKLRLSTLQVVRQKPKAITFEEASQRLKAKIKTLTQEKIQNELDGLIPKSFITGGGETIIKASVLRLCQQLEALK